jgi:hypothetical protein
MGILSNIFHKIFPPSHPAVKQTQAPASTGSMQSANPQTATQPGTQAGSSAAPQPAPLEIVDVELILTRMAAQQGGQTLNWRASIVDLLKLLNLDSSLEARKELAHELDYRGDTNDSARMNIWLHRHLMNRLAANGGKVPDDLKD